MALSASRELDRYVDQELRAVPVDASTTIYKGALVGLNSGFARELNAGDDFVGIAYEEINNASGSAGDTSVRVYTTGDFEHTLGSAARSNNGANIYASADDTITTTSTSNTPVGRQIDVSATDTIILRIKTIYDTE